MSEDVIVLVEAAEDVLVVETANEPITIEYSERGPTGPEGPTGLVSLRFEQPIAALEWTIVTGLDVNLFGVYVEDSAGTENRPASIAHPVLGTTVLTFAAATDGYAVLY